MTTPTRRADLAALVDAAPEALNVLAGVALAMYDRWELLDATKVMHEAVAWADPKVEADEQWRQRVLWWISDVYQDLLVAMVENIALDEADRVRK